MLTEPDTIGYRIDQNRSTYFNHVDAEIHAVAGLQVRQIGLPRFWE